MSVLAKLKSENTEFTTWRHHIHQNPETCFEEVKTSEYVANLLTSWGVEIHRGLAKTAVVGVIKGKTNVSGRTIGLRADMDALNMSEETNLAYASKNPGKMHACGHDGHTTMLLAACKHLAATRDFDGTVYAIFQPAEEGGGGADVMIQEGFFKQFPCETIYGMHNWPWMPLGTMAICEGAVSASTDEFEMTVTGKGGHAAFPHMTIDPIACAAQIVSSLQHLVSRTVDPLDSAVISVTRFLAGGEALNVIPETVELGGTIRTLKPETRAKMEEKFRHMAKTVAAAFGAEVNIKWHKGYPPTVNTAVETDFARKIAGEIVGKDKVQEFTPMMGGEDFAYFLEKRPGAYIVLGQGKTDNDPGLHSPHYDFNDNAIPYGAAYWVTLAETALAPK